MVVDTGVVVDWIEVGLVSIKLGVVGITVMLGPSHIPHETTQASFIKEGLFSHSPL